MSDASGFLSRWSQRKRAAAEQAAAPIPGEGDPASQDAAAAPQQAGDAVAPLPEMPPLPPLEEITAATDISVFMHPAVPEPLRAAALRRMWAIDPAIRDHVSEAVDYAYDWNTPGGVPGNGPLGPADDVARMISDLFYRPDPEAAKEAEPAETAELDPTPGPDSPIDAVATVPDAATPSLHASTTLPLGDGGPISDRDLQPQDASSGHRSDVPRHLIGIRQADDLQGFAGNPTDAPDASAGADAPPAGARRHGGAVPA